MGDQALDAAEGFGQAEAAQAMKEGADRCLATGQIDAEHGAESTLLPGRDPMAGMIYQPGIVDRRDSRMPDDGFDDGLRILLVSPDAGVQVRTPRTVK